MRSTVFPAAGVHFRPAFWGVERDLSDVVNRIESIWENQVSKPTVADTDFKETEKAYLMAIEMPGVGKSDLALEIEDGRVMVNGIRKKSLLAENEEAQKVFKVFALPQDVDKDKVQAHIEDGVLYLALPKIEKEKPKKIELSDNLNSGVWTKFLKLQN